MNDLHVKHIEVIKRAISTMLVERANNRSEFSPHAKLVLE
jgi:hypothetical protein